MLDARSVAELFCSRVQATPESPALRFRANGRWQHLSWADWHKRSRDIAAGLSLLGLSSGERVGFFGNICAEWLLCDMAVQMSGAVTCALPGSDSPERLAERLRLAPCRLVLVEDVDLLARLAAIREQVDCVESYVVMRPEARSRWASGFDGAAVVTVEDALDSYPEGLRDRVVRLDELELLGGEAIERGNAPSIEESVRRIRPEWPSTVVFATGLDDGLRAVVGTHGNHLSAVFALAEALPVEKDDIQLLTLPVGNIRGIVGYRFGLATGAALAIWQGPQKLAETLQAVQPTFLSTTPDLCEKVFARIQGESRERGGLEQAMFQWAIGVGREMLAARGTSAPPSRLLVAKHKAAEQVAFRRIRALFGGRLRFLLVSGAALKKDISELFTAAGVLVLEGYGLSVSTGVSHLNRTFRYRHGTVGQPLLGVETRVLSDGEIQLRGPNIAPGHLQGDAVLPCVLDDGWLRTGDLGELDDDGFLTLRGRKGDTIVLLDGQRVTPERVERGLCESEFISRAVVHGDGRSFLTALLTLEEEPLRRWANGEKIPASVSFAELCRQPAVYVLVDRLVRKYDATVPSHEEVRKFAILDYQFTAESGELSPMGKLERRTIAARHRALIESFYREPY